MRKGLYPQMTQMGADEGREKSYPQVNTNEHEWQLVSATLPVTTVPVRAYLPALLDTRAHSGCLLVGSFICVPLRHLRIKPLPGSS
jgi:hypothetical protein